MLLVSLAYADTFWECDPVATPADALAYAGAMGSSLFTAASDEVDVWADSTCAATSCAASDATSISCEEVDCVTVAGATWYQHTEEFLVYDLVFYLDDHRTVTLREVTPPATAGLDWEWASLESDVDEGAGTSRTYTVSWGGVLQPGWPADGSFVSTTWGFSNIDGYDSDETWQGPTCEWATTFDYRNWGEEDWTVDVTGSPFVEVRWGWDTCDSGVYISATVDGVVYGAVDDDDWTDDPDDADRDIYSGTDDCDDTNPDIHPCAEETAGDGVDSNCNGLSDTDADGDGHIFDYEGGYDCDDTDPAAWPGAVEVPYDGIDQDCSDGDLVDVDGDGEASTVAGGDDCDDADPVIHPSATDIPYDGVDQDCTDGDLDDVDEDGEAAVAVGGTDCDDADPSINTAAADLGYDGIDQDCDGVDTTDWDGDGFEAEEVGGPDCNDLSVRAYPGATEVRCDGIDQDCDGADDCGDTGGDDTGSTPAPRPKPEEDTGCGGRAWLFLALLLPIRR